MTKDDIERLVADLYVGILGRQPDPGGAEHAVDQILRTGDIADMVRQFTHCDEAQRRREREHRPQSGGNAGASAEAIDDFEFRIPGQLRRPDDAARRILLIGSCLMDSWEGHLAQHEPWLGIERITFNNASPLPPMGHEELRTFDFQMIQLPLRSLIMENVYFGLKYDDADGWQALFDQACQYLELNLSAAMAYSRQSGIRSFILNFPVPQQNPMGRLQSRYALNNLAFFIEQLNQRLTDLVAAYSDAHVVDFDAIIATYGRKYFQDDFLQTINHGSALSPGIGPIDQLRLEPLGDMEALYAPKVGKIVVAAYEEAKALDRTIRQQDSVKLVIFDLDDTLWRGIVAEAEEIGEERTEGWPLGIVEAISHLWRRGILVAIVSKNDEERTRANWAQLYGRRHFPLERFVSVKIGWGAKPAAIAEILGEVNLLPGNVVFVDDNPVERAGVKEAFPDIRVLGGAALEWRRVLLWSAETQTAALTAESAARTEMIQAQIRRGGEAATMDRTAFLASLDLNLTVCRITSEGDSRFARAIELINKTNQFNTTGKRWSQAEIGDLLRTDGYLMVGIVADRFVDYGLVAVAIVQGGTIEQYVMSCRVFGMEVEHAMVRATEARIAARGHDTVRAPLQATEKNKLTLSLFDLNGYGEEPAGLWSKRAEGNPAYPRHITVKMPE